MTAGFAWKWETKKHKDAFDIVIEGVPKRWNSSQKDWVNPPNAVNEVGCIHTAQGYDLNYGFEFWVRTFTTTPIKEPSALTKPTSKMPLPKKASDDDL